MCISQHIMCALSVVGQVSRHVGDAVSKGAEVVLGGRCDPDLGGTFYQPSVLTGVNTDMIMTSEEIFGPVAPIIK